MDYYKILGVDRSASQDDIKQAYRKLASKHHPDKGGDTEQFQIIQEAYSILSDLQKKQEYDNPTQKFGFNQQQFADIFQHFGFNPFGNDPFQQIKRRNQDIRIELECSLEDTLEDQDKTLNIRLPNGSNKNYNIKIPKGVTSGTTIKYPNLGDNSFSNLPSGDLLVLVKIFKHKEFEVHGLDLYRFYKLNAMDAIVGTDITIASLDNRLYSIKIPAGTQNNSKFKIPGKGLPGFQNDIQGNLIVVIDIQIPFLSEEQKQLIKQIQLQG